MADKDWADEILLTIEGPVARVTLNAPARRNAFDTAMLAAFEDTITALDRNRAVEVVVLRAEGPSFCGGTDLKELATLDADDTLHWQGRTGAAVDAWSRLRAVTVTAFNGPAIGSGAVIGLASDLRVAADTARLAFPEVSFGIPMTWNGIPLLTALLGPDRTKRLLLLSETLEPDDLLRLDLVSAVVPRNELEAATAALVERVLAAPVLARQMTKRAVLAAAGGPGAGAAHEPFMASLAVQTLGEAGVGAPKKSGS